MFRRLQKNTNSWENLRFSVGFPWLQKPLKKIKVAVSQQPHPQAKFIVRFAYLLQNAVVLLAKEHLFYTKQYSLSRINFLTWPCSIAYFQARTQNYFSLIAS